MESYDKCEQIYTDIKESSDVSQIASVYSNESENGIWVEFFRQSGCNSDKFGMYISNPIEGSVEFVFLGEIPDDKTIFDAEPIDFIFGEMQNDNDDQPNLFRDGKVYVQYENVIREIIRFAKCIASQSSVNDCLSVDNQT